MVAIIVEAVFLPLFIVLGIVAGKRRRDLQAKRIAAYRASPESRIPKLNH